MPQRHRLRSRCDGEGVGVDLQGRQIRSSNGARYGPSLAFGMQIIPLGPEHSAHDLPGGRMTNQIPVKTANSRSSSLTRNVMSISYNYLELGSSLNSAEYLKERNPLAKITVRGRVRYGRDQRHVASLTTALLHRQSLPAELFVDVVGYLFSHLARRNC
jgi:hypothetical protein